MATGILMPGAVVANPLDIIPPAIANLMLWTYFGTDLAHSPNAGSAGVLTAGAGTVVWSPHYVSCKGMTGSLQAAGPVNTTTSQTWMGVARYMGGGTTGANGVLLQLGGNSVILSMTTTQLTIQAGGLVTITPLTLVGGGNFKFLAFTTQSSGPHTFYNLTDATQGPAAASGSVTAASGVAIGIGGPPTVSGTNDRNIDIAFETYAQTTLTKPQIDAQYAAVKNVLAQYGIVV